MGRAAAAAAAAVVVGGIWDSSGWVYVPPGWLNGYHVVFSTNSDKIKKYV